jgi:hypothetical protein
MIVGQSDLRKMEIEYPFEISMHDVVIVQVFEPHGYIQNLHQKLG